MAPHSSTLAWKIPWMEEPGGLQSMGSLRVRHDWATSLSLFTFHFHALEKERATHSSVLAWRIPGTEEPGGLPSMGSHRVVHNWSDLAADSVCFHCFSLPLESSKVFLTLSIPLLPLSWILSEQPSSFTTPGETGLHRVPGDCLIAKSSRQFPSSPHLTSYPMGRGWSCLSLKHFTWLLD